MKPLFRKISEASGYCFSFIEEAPPLFETPWHFHPEYELIFIKNATGRRYMGDHIADFCENELVLIGPNLPHFWQNDDKTDLSKSKAYVIHFKPDFLGNAYFNLPETLPINKLLEKAQLGLKIKGETNRIVCDMIENLPEVAGFERLLLLQKALHTIAESYDIEPLANAGFVESFKAVQDERINKVFEYVMYNFREKIALQDIAAIAFMSEIAFCRYFKSRTGKSFFTFLNDIRIGYACRLLLESDVNVTGICYESGFNNLSHFNRQFKQHTKETPQHYRELFKK